MKTAHNKKQKEIAEEKMTNKQANNLKIEGRLLKQIEELKNHGGPFTNSKAIGDFLNDGNIDEKVKTRG